MSETPASTPSGGAEVHVAPGVVGTVIQNVNYVVNAIGSWFTNGYQNEPIWDATESDPNSHGHSSLHVRHVGTQPDATEMNWESHVHCIHEVGGTYIPWQTRYSAGEEALTQIGKVKDMSQKVRQRDRKKFYEIQNRDPVDEGVKLLQESKWLPPACNSSFAAEEEILSLIHI